MPNNRKISVKNIKVGDGVHPSSRKAGQVNRAIARSDRIKRNVLKRTEDKLPKVERMLWFRYAMDEDAMTLTKPQIHELIEQFLARHDEELASLQALHRKGQPRPKAAREDAIMNLQIAEKSEYVSGMELPDLTIAKVVTAFRAWEGDTNALKTIRMAKFSNPGNLGNMVKDVKRQLEEKNTNGMDLS